MDGGRRVQLWEREAWVDPHLSVAHLLGEAVQQGGVTMHSGEGVARLRLAGGAAQQQGTVTGGAAAGGVWPRSHGGGWKQGKSSAGRAA